MLVIKVEKTIERSDVTKVQRLYRLGFTRLSADRFVKSTDRPNYYAAIVKKYCGILRYNMRIEMFHPKLNRKAIITVVI